MTFSECREQVNLHLVVMDFDLTLLEEEPTAITHTALMRRNHNIKHTY